jgi:hypothetical protein
MATLAFGAAFLPALPRYKAEPEQWNTGFLCRCNKGSAPMRALSRPACAPSGFGAFGALIGVAPIAAIFLCAPALAEPSVSHGLCAAHGPDYVEVAGGGRCVRIGAHVRAEMTRGAEIAPASLISAPVGAIADGFSGVARTIQGPAAASAPQLYRR